MNLLIRGKNLIIFQVKLAGKKSNHIINDTYAI